MWRKYILLLVAGILLISSQVKAIKVEYYNSMLWSNVLDVKLRGNYAYCAYEYGLLILDITDPKTPKPLGQCHTPGGMDNIEISGNYAYLSGWDTELFTIDINDPLDPILIDPNPNFGTRIMFNISGDNALVLDTSDNLIIYDIIERDNPQKLAQCKIEHGLNCIGTYQKYLYLYKGPGSTFSFDGCKIEIIDYTDSQQPKLVDSLKTYGPVSSVFIKDKYLYAVVSGFGLQIYDLSNPSSPKLISEYFIEQADDGRQIFVDNQHAYISFLEKAPLKIIDITDNNTPIEIEFECTPPYVFKFNVSNNVMAIITPDFELAFYDLNQMGAITRMSNFKSYSANDMAISGKYTFVADNKRGMLVLDSTRPAQNNIISEYDIGKGCSNIQIAGQYAYLGIDHRGIQVVNISKPDMPRLEVKYDFPDNLSGSIGELIIEDNIIYLTIEFYGLVTLDVSNPLKPSWLGDINLGEGGKGIVKISDRIFIASNRNGISVISVRNPSKPELIGSYQTRYSRDLVIRGNYAYTTYDNGLLILDIANPTNITLVDSLKIETPSKGLFTSRFDWLNIYDSYLLLTGDFPNSRLAIVDITQPTTPVLWKTLGDFSWVNSIKTYSDKLYIVTWHGIIVYRLIN